jgi:hypothetical protein
VSKSVRKWRVWLPDGSGPQEIVKAGSMKAAVEEKLAEWRKEPVFENNWYRPGLRIAAQEIVEHPSQFAEPPSFEVFIVRKHGHVERSAF